MTQVSMLPNSSVARIRARRDPVDVVEDPSHLGAREVGRERQAGLGAEAVLPAVGHRPLQIRSVRVSCQTMALWTASPVVRSQTTVVSRWLVMPMAASWSLVIPADAIAAPTTSWVRLHTSAGSCSTQPAFGKICSCSFWAIETTVPP